MFNLYHYTTYESVRTSVCPVQVNDLDYTSAFHHVDTCIGSTNYEALAKRVLPSLFVWADAFYKRKVGSPNVGEGL